MQILRQYGEAVPQWASNIMGQPYRAWNILKRMELEFLRDPINKNTYRIRYVNIIHNFSKILNQCIPYQHIDVVVFYHGILICVDEQECTEQTLSEIADGLSEKLEVSVQPFDLEDRVYLFRFKEAAKQPQAYS